MLHLNFRTSKWESNSRHSTLHVNPLPSPSSNSHKPLINQYGVVAHKTLRYPSWSRTFYLTASTPKLPTFMTGNTRLWLSRCNNYRPYLLRRLRWKYEYHRRYRRIRHHSLVRLLLWDKILQLFRGVCIYTS